MLTPHLQRNGILQATLNTEQQAAAQAIRDKIAAGIYTHEIPVCPTCGGGFVPRPIRPKKNWRDGKRLGLEHHPASDKRVHSPYSKEDLEAHVARIKDVPVDER